jgi:hypothetical protein
MNAHGARWNGGERVDLNDLGQEVSDQLAFRTGLHIKVEMRGHIATLRGGIPSAEARGTLLRLAADLMPRWQLVDELFVEPQPETHFRAGEWSWTDVVD